MSGIAADAAGTVAVPAGNQSSWIGRRWRALRLALVVGALALLPLAWYAALFPFVSNALGYDMRGAYAPAAHAILHGQSPYPSLDDPSLVERHAYVYPPLLAFAVMPFALVSDTTAGILGVVLCIALVPATLLVLGIRDWRCHGAAFLWAPTFNAVQNANISLAIAFGLAVAWRFRGHARRFAAVVGLAVAVKLFAWPLLVWPLSLRRRRRQAVLAAAVAAVAIVGSWAIIGFEGVAGYPSLLSRLTDLEKLDSYSVEAAFVTLGVPGSASRILEVSVAAALMSAAWWWARCRDERRAMTAAVAAALALSPIVWLHYFTILLVPIAVFSPRLSPIWFVPCAFWTANVQKGNGAPWQTILATTVAALIVAYCLCLRPGRSACAGSGVDAPCER